MFYVFSLSLIIFSSSQIDLYCFYSGQFTKRATTSSVSIGTQAKSCWLACKGLNQKKERSVYVYKYLGCAWTAVSLFQCVILCQMQLHLIPANKNVPRLPGGLKLTRWLFYPYLDRQDAPTPPLSTESLLGLIIWPLVPLTQLCLSTKEKDKQASVVYGLSVQYTAHSVPFYL